MKDKRYIELYNFIKEKEVTFEKAILIDKTKFDIP